MAKNEVAVTLKAYDQTSAAFASAEKRMNRFVSSAKKLATGLGGILTANALGSWLRRAAEDAARVDPVIKERIDSIANTFEQLRIRAGQAILGDAGVVYGINKFANNAAVAIPKIVGFLNTLYTKLNDVYEASIRTAFAINKFFGGKGDPRGQFSDVTSGSASFSVGGRTRSTGGARGRGGITPGADWGPAGDLLNANVTSVRGQSLIGSLIPSPEAIEAQLDALSPQIPAFLSQMQFFDDLRVQFGERIAMSITDAFAFGIESAVASGSIGDGFKALSGALLSGIGSAMIEFGSASLIAATLMEKIKTGLASFLPGGAIGASLAMIAIGATLKGVASRAFGGMGRTSNAALAGSLGGSGTQAFAAQGTIIVDIPANKLLSTNDPFFQRAIMDTIGKATGRRVVLRPS